MLLSLRTPTPLSNRISTVFGPQWLSLHTGRGFGGGDFHITKQWSVPSPCTCPLKWLWGKQQNMMRKNNFSLVVTNWSSRISHVCKHTPKCACFVHNLPHEMVLEVAAALIQISVSLCGWPNFSELSLHTTLIAFHLVQKHFMHIFPLSNTLSP